MKSQIVEGKEVTLSSAQGAISRVAVKLEGNVVRVCRRDEYEKARAEGREPVTVGFKVEDILS